MFTKPDLERMMEWILYNWIWSLLHRRKQLCEPGQKHVAGEDKGPLKGTFLLMFI